MPGPIIFEVDVQIALSLASIGYLGEGASNDEKFKLMTVALKQPDLPTAGRWQIVWGPAEADTSLWYMAAGPDAQGDPALAIVIRGTQMKLKASLKLDRELYLVPVPWVDPSAPAGALISQGFAQEMTNLLVAVDPRSGLTAVQFLRKLLGAGKPRPKVKVIGHSLGGATAPIASLWVKREFPELEIRPFPFGGQSPGNQAFSDWYTGAFPRWPSRYINNLDATPMMFAEFQAMKKLWGRPSIPGWLRLFIDGVEVIMAAEHIRYVSTPRARVFEGHLYDISGLLAWEDEASAQHEHFYYMFLSGIPLKVIRRARAGVVAAPQGRGPACVRAAYHRYGATSTFFLARYLEVGHLSRPRESIRSTPRGAAASRRCHGPSFRAFGAAAALPANRPRFSRSRRRNAHLTTGCSGRSASRPAAEPERWAARVQ